MQLLLPRGSLDSMRDAVEEELEHGRAWAFDNVLGALVKKGLVRLLPSTVARQRIGRFRHTPRTQGLPKARKLW